MPSDKRGDWLTWLFGPSRQPKALPDWVRFDVPGAPGVSWSVAEREAWPRELGRVDAAYWAQLEPDGREAFMSSVLFGAAVKVARARRHVNQASLGRLGDDQENPRTSVQGFWEAGLMLSSRPSRRRVWFERIMAPVSGVSVDDSNQLKLELGGESGSGE